jgi:uncharacterized protein YodC (DUF2158 family)
MSGLKVVSFNRDKEPAKPGNPFKKGQKVHLMSGGPLMTVETPGPEWTKCIWFDECDNDMRGSFLNDTLEIYVEPKPKRKRREPVLQATVMRQGKKREASPK